MLYAALTKFLKVISNMNINLKYLIGITMRYFSLNLMRGVFDMIYKFSDLKSKEVIHIAEGERIGFISDMEIDSESGKIISLCVPGAYRAMGLLGREPERTIKWEDIKKIGDDLVIIETNEN